MKKVELVLCFENEAQGKIVIKPTNQLPEQLLQNLKEILDDNNYVLTFVAMIEL
jgi:negative regulator of sigma E activity